MWQGIPKTEVEGKGTVQLNSGKSMDTLFLHPWTSDKNQAKRFKHLARRTSNKDKAARPCIPYVGNNLDLFDGPEGSEFEGSEGSQDGTVCKGGTQKGETPKFMRVSLRQKKMVNHAAAHVEIQLWKGKTSGEYEDDTQWDTLGDWLIMTTKPSNSQALRKQVGGSNPNEWRHLIVGATAIQL